MKQQIDNNRYILHYTDLLTEGEMQDLRQLGPTIGHKIDIQDQLYSVAANKAKEQGGKKYRSKHFYKYFCIHSKITRCQ